MTPQLLGELARAIGDMTADPAIRCLVLTGAGLFALVLAATSFRAALRQRRPLAAR